MKRSRGIAWVELRDREVLAHRERVLDELARDATPAAKRGDPRRERFDAGNQVIEPALLVLVRQIGAGSTASNSRLPVLALTRRGDLRSKRYACLCDFGME